MKRSEINAIVADADRFVRDQCFHLPPFAYWSTADWETNKPAAGEVIACNLGWDITDFGTGDFQNKGLVLFTIRNGAVQSGTGKQYAEKILVVNPKQVTPYHFHWQKTEDIINRGGGNLHIKMYQSTGDEQFDSVGFTVYVDSIPRTLEAGGVVVLTPGESITLTPGLYHSFWAEDGRVLVGEVSSVNDDNTDNRFYENLGRFPTVEEDVPPDYLLVSDYAKYLG